MRGNKAGSSGLAPVVAPRASWSLTLGLIVATLRDWRRRHVGRRELAKYDERTLMNPVFEHATADAGVSMPCTL